MSFTLAQLPGLPSPPRRGPRPPTHPLFSLLLNTIHHAMAPDVALHSMMFRVCHFITVCILPALPIQPDGLILARSGPGVHVRSTSQGNAALATAIHVYSRRVHSRVRQTHNRDTAVKMRAGGRRDGGCHHGKPRSHSRLPLPPAREIPPQGKTALPSDRQWFEKGSPGGSPFGLARLGVIAFAYTELG